MKPNVKKYAERLKSPLTVVWNYLNPSVEKKPENTQEEKEFFTPIGDDAYDYTNIYKLTKAAMIIAPIAYLVTYGVMSYRNSPADIENLQDVPKLAYFYGLLTMFHLFHRSELRKQNARKAIEQNTDLNAQQHLDHN